MKASASTTWAAFAAAATLFASSLACGADPATKCDKMAEAVRAAVEREPKRVLIIVEDATVENESCVADIVKAAILASKANADLVKQIVLTATNVAPKMAAAIAETAAALSPAAVPAVSAQSTDGGKSVKQVISVQPPESGGGPDYTPAPVVIGGVYLVQPGAVPVAATNQTTPSQKVVVHHKPPSEATPQSPSKACPKDP